MFRETPVRSPSISTSSPSYTPPRPQRLRDGHQAPFAMDIKRIWSIHIKRVWPIHIKRASGR
ncbi:hypothetical protein K523DRAFT_324339 [Schizophyllum commune Tattone D]|nr:hypothetical protein K523DRAFT_324339 [Schizophyllum commune Tattone D]